MEKSNEWVEQEKLASIRNLVEFKTEQVDGKKIVILDLVGAMKKTFQKGFHESGSFKDPDENSKLSTGVALATGGKDRMLAIVELHKAFPEAQIVTMSKTRSEDPTVPTYAAMTRDELVRKGVAPESIMLEEESVSTLTEYISAAKLWKEQQWENLIFVTSNWHVPRSEALLNHVKTFAEPNDREVVVEFVQAIQSGKIHIHFVGSTDVLSIKSDKYKRYFEAVAEDPGMQARVLVEQNTLRQIADGDYGGKKLPVEDKIWQNKL